MELARGGLTYGTRFAAPVEMSGDGVAGGCESVVELLVGKSSHAAIYLCHVMTWHVRLDSEPVDATNTLQHLNLTLCSKWDAPAKLTTALLHMAQTIRRN